MNTFNIETTNRIYTDIINNVIENIRLQFMTCGVKEDVLQLLKKTWESKIFGNRDVENESAAKETSQAENRFVPAKIKIPSKFTNNQDKTLTIQLPINVVENKEFKNILRNECIFKSLNNLPVSTAAVILQKRIYGILSLNSSDGACNLSDDDEESSETDSSSDNGIVDNSNTEKNGDSPLNSNDDLTDEDPSETLETDNIVICQYKHVLRRTNKWRFSLKSGIITNDGKEYFFDNALGTAEW